MVEEMETSQEIPTKDSNPSQTHISNGANKGAYAFDGLGNYSPKEWDLTEGKNHPQFCWYHVELPKWNQRLSLSAEYLISALCPPLRLQDILTLVSNGPFCGHVDGALFFRVNSPGPAASDFTLRLAARVTESSVVTVSLGKVPRLGFSQGGESLRDLLSVTPSVAKTECGGKVEGSEEEFMIPENFLEFMLTMNHSEEADNPVPKSVSNLVVHIVDTHVDQVQDMVTKLEMELDSVELQLDREGSSLKKQMLDDRRFPKMHLNLQRLIQVVSHGEQVFPRVKEKCATKSWFTSEDLVSLEELIGRLRRLKENLGFIANRVTAVQAGLDSWQAEQINRKLYYLSFCSMIFLPLSVVTGIFGMNVGGVPWTGQNGPNISDGFQNVMILCVALLVLLLFCFIFPSLYARFSNWKFQRVLRRNSSTSTGSRPKSNYDTSKRSWTWRSLLKGEIQRHGYFLIRRL